MKLKSSSLLSFPEYTCLLLASLIYKLMVGSKAHSHDQPLRFSLRHFVRCVQLISSCPFLPNALLLSGFECHGQSIYANEADSEQKDESLHCFENGVMG